MSGWSGTHRGIELRKQQKGLLVTMASSLSSCAQRSVALSSSRGGGTMTWTSWPQQETGHAGRLWPQVAGLQGQWGPSRHFPPRPRRRNCMPDNSRHAGCPRSPGPSPALTLHGDPWRIHHGHDGKAHHPGAPRRDVAASGHQ